MQLNVALTCTVVGAVPSPATFPEQHNWSPTWLHVGVPTKCGFLANAGVVRVKEVASPRAATKTRFMFRSSHAVGGCLEPVAFGTAPAAREPPARSRRARPSPRSSAGGAAVLPA